MISQIQLVNVICQAISDHGNPSLLGRQLNAIIRAADDILAELRTPERVVMPGAGLYDWVTSDRTGSSSLWMAKTLAGHRSGPPAKYAYPHDPSDFNRCLGLLDACPELRERLPEMAATGPEWAALVAHWDELEALFREEAPTGQGPRLWARMQELLGDAA